MKLVKTAALPSVYPDHPRHLKVNNEQFRLRYWRTMDGRVIKIADLADRHISNIINYVLKKRHLYGDQAERLIAEFHAEAERRGLSIEFLEDAPYPASDYPPKT